MLIQKQRHYFANKASSSQGYGFSSGHVWMCEDEGKCYLKVNYNEKPCELRTTGIKLWELIRTTGIQSQRSMHC